MIALRVSVILSIVVLSACGVDGVPLSPVGTDAASDGIADVFAGDKGSL